MAIDTPATIAILGAGPIGLEAALYARFLGYNVIIYEQGEVAEHLRRCGHVSLLAPFAACHSSLGRNAILAQEDEFAFPADDAILTGQQWLERYLQPLAATDLLSDHLRLQTQVLGVTRSELLKNDSVSTAERGDWTFRIVWQRRDGTTGEDETEVVIDTTGVWSQPNALGAGGLPAVGEAAARQAGVLVHGLPDILGPDRANYAGKHTVLIGGGHSAATNAVALARLAEEVPGTKITWLIRREGPAAGGAIARLPNDPLPSRDQLAQQANALLIDKHPAFTFCPATTVRRISPTAANLWQVECVGEHAATLDCDRIIANVGQRPAVDLFRELQVQLCPASETPVPISGDSKRICTTEPNFYILGRKSMGRRSGFTFTDGLAQIRDLFTIIGERETLDLYASNRRIVG